MTVKNPFESGKVPESHADQSIEAASHTDEDDSQTTDTSELKRSKAPRKILKNLSSLAVPVVASGIAIWIFMSDSQPGKRHEPVAAPPSEIDSHAQLNNTSVLLDSMKSEAGNTPLPAERPAGGSASGAEPSTAPRSYAQQYDPAQAEKEKLVAEAQKRREEILASPLQAQGGSFKTVDAQDGGSGVGDGPRARLNDLQAELDTMNKRRDEILRSNSPDRMLEAINKQMNAGGDTQIRRRTDEDFLQGQADASNQNSVARQQRAAASLLVNQGTVIRAVLLTGIKNDLPGRVTAQVTADVYDSVQQRYVLIPKHSKLIGTFSTQVVAGQERLLVAMNRLIRPDGSWISLGGASAADLIGQSGMEAEVNNHFLKMFGSSLVIGAASLLLPSADRTITTTAGYGASQQGGTVLGMALNDSLKALLERNRLIKPTLTVHPGDEFLFLAAQDFELSPYKP